MNADSGIMTMSNDEFIGHCINVFRSQSPDSPAVW